MAAMKDRHNAAAISLICCRNLARWEGALGGRIHPSASMIQTFEKSNQYSERSATIYFGNSIFLRNTKGFLYIISSLVSKTVFSKISIESLVKKIVNKLFF